MMLKYPRKHFDKLVVESGNEFNACVDVQKA